MTVPPADRAGFLAERRASAVRRFDTVHSRRYDEFWGWIADTHADQVRRLLAHLPAAPRILDAACGTGKYWPVLLAAGARVTGADQSQGMLARLREKVPDADLRCLALQDLAAATELHRRFDGVLCVDAMEYVGPEDWPGVLAGLAAALVPGGHAYISVEQAASPTPPSPLDPRQVPGEESCSVGHIMHTR